MINVFGILVVLALIILRVLLIFGVKYECQRRDTENTTVWCVLTAVFGLLCALTLICFVPKINKEAKNKKGIIILLSMVMAVAIMVLVIIFGYIPAQEKADEFEQNNFTQDDKYSFVLFQNDNGEYIVYDKMGKAYTMQDYNKGFMYYTKDGDAYITYHEIADAEEYYREAYGIKNVETGEKIEFGSFGKDYFIGEDGYLYIFDELEQCKSWNIYSPDDDEMNDYVYYTKDGMIMYSDNDCGWDKDGNLVLVEGFKWKDLKYSDIPESEMNWDE